MTTQEILDLAAEFDLITFGPQDLVMFAREVEAKTIERCAKVCEEFEIPKEISGAHPDYLEGKHMAVHQCAAAIRALGDNDE